MFARAHVSCRISSRKRPFDWTNSLQHLDNSSRGIYTDTKIPGVRSCRFRTARSNVTQPSRRIGCGSRPSYRLADRRQYHQFAGLFWQWWGCPAIAGRGCTRVHRGRQVVAEDRRLRPSLGSPPTAWRDVNLGISLVWSRGVGCRDVSRPVASKMRKWRSNVLVGGADVQDNKMSVEWKKPSGRTRFTLLTVIAVDGRPRPARPVSASTSRPPAASRTARRGRVQRLCLRTEDVQRRSGPPGRTLRETRETQ